MSRIHFYLSLLVYSCVGQKKRRTINDTWTKTLITIPALKNSEIREKNKTEWKYIFEGHSPLVKNEGTQIYLKTSARQTNGKFVKIPKGKRTMEPNEDRNGFSLTATGWYFTHFDKIKKKNRSVESQLIGYYIQKERDHPSRLSP